MERVVACPLCGSGARGTLHRDLFDYAFATAPGRWTLHECGGCGCAYLDPRPSAATLSLAYERYYTHGSGPAASILARLRQGIQDAYLNARYGTSYPNALPGAQYLAILLPRIRSYLVVSFARHLGDASGGNTRLLDVGCGNGAFLQCAARLGWDAEGVDSDAAAVAAARAAGCRAMQGNLNELPFEKARYRHITLNHVIEHVDDPIALLRRCFELLAPGGRLWLETPNLRSFGHQVFGAAWRGLEPPRHLVLFDRRSLSFALARAGFSDIEFRAHPAVTLFIWEESRRIARACGTGARSGMLGSPLGAVLAEARSAMRLDRAEFLTCTAFRRGASDRAGP